MGTAVEVTLVWAACFVPSLFATDHVVMAPPGLCTHILLPIHLSFSRDPHLHSCLIPGPSIMYMPWLMKLAVMEARAVAPDRDPDAKNISWCVLCKLNKRVALEAVAGIVSNTHSVQCLSGIWSCSPRMESLSKWCFHLGEGQMEQREEDRPEMWPSSPVILKVHNCWYHGAGPYKQQLSRPQVVKVISKLPCPGSARLKTNTGSLNMICTYSASRVESDSSLVDTKWSHWFVFGTMLYKGNPIFWC